MADMMKLLDPKRETGIEVDKYVAAALKLDSWTLTGHRALLVEALTLLVPTQVILLSLFGVYTFVALVLFNGVRVSFRLADQALALAARVNSVIERVDAMLGQLATLDAQLAKQTPAPATVGHKAAGSVDSSAALLTVVPDDGGTTPTPPSITLQPAPVTVNAGLRSVFCVAIRNSAARVASSRALVLPFAAASARPSVAMVWA